MWSKRRGSRCATHLLSGKVCRFSLPVYELRVDAEESAALTRHICADNIMSEDDSCGKIGAVFEGSFEVSGGGGHSIDVAVAGTIVM